MCVCVWDGSSFWAKRTSLVDNNKIQQDKACITRSIEIDCTGKIFSRSGKYSSGLSTTNIINMLLWYGSLENIENIVKIEKQLNSFQEIKCLNIQYTSLGQHAVFFIERLRLTDRSTIHVHVIHQWNQQIHEWTKHQLISQNTKCLLLHTSINKNFSVSIYFVLLNEFYNKQNSNLTFNTHPIQIIRV